MGWGWGDSTPGPLAPRCTGLSVCVSDLEEGPLGPGAGLGGDTFELTGEIANLLNP